MRYDFNFKFRYAIHSLQNAGKKLEKESAVCRRTALFLVNLDGRQDTKTTQDRKKETKINVPQD
jgi:hypothetical protein